MMKKLRLLCYLFTLVLLMASCGSRRFSGVLTDGKGNSKAAAAGILATDASDMRGIGVAENKLSSYAQLLGVAERDLKNTSLYSFIADWMGTPHRLGGQNKSGIDCSAFVGMLQHQVYAYALPRSSRDMAAAVQSRKLKSLQEGDLVFFSFGGKQIDHVGVYLRNNKFVHVSTRRGVIISNLEDPWYVKYLVHGGHVKI